MKATPSPATGKVLPERSAAVSLPISVWEAESFGVPILEVAAGHLGWELPDWENIEAVGAADDSSRFRIDSPGAEPLVYSR